jgi:hypothetical protein
VASDSSGNFVVVWESDQDGSGYGVFGQRFASTGAPLGPEFRVNTRWASSQGRPAVASDSFGNFFVVWQSLASDGSGYGVFGQVFASSGAPFGPEFRLNTYTTGNQRDPAIASDSSGNFVVVWGGYFQGGWYPDVSAGICCSSARVLGPEFRVNTYTPHLQGSPAVASDSSGNFVVVWASVFQDGASYGVFGQRYDSTGAPLGPEFRVNTYTTNWQYRPAVAVDASGNFVVVWRSQTQDGSSFGIFGQRYSAIAPVE